MIRKNKTPQTALYQEVDDSRTVVNDFRLRNPFESYRTVEYRLYPALEEGKMLPLLDQHLERLFAGELDEGNGDALVSLIFGSARQALPDLRRQQADHSDTLHRFEVRRTADREDFRRLLEQVQRKLSETDEEYEEICRMIAAATGKGGTHEN